MPTPDTALPTDSLHYEGRQALITLSNPTAARMRELVNLATGGSFDYVRWRIANQLEVAVLDDVCSTKVDLAFLMDGSDSMSTDDFNQSTAFVSRVTQFFEISPDEMQVTMVTFSSYSGCHVVHVSGRHPRLPCRHHPWLPTSRTRGTVTCAPAFDISPPAPPATAAARRGAAFMH